MFEKFVFGKYQGLKITSRNGQEVFFTGKAADFSISNFESETNQFYNQFDVEKLIVLNQVHGSNIVKVDEFITKQSGARGCSDADGFLLIPRDGTKVKLHNLCFGIRTADCLPIFIQTDNQMLMLHAGWRGLASGILQNALKLVGNEKVISFIIGPSAGASSYEVGAEVVEMFDPKVLVASQCEGKVGKFMLNLKATAVKVFEQDSVLKSSDCLVEVCQICTINDLEWHSHRREGSKRGSNLMFLKMLF